MNMNLNFKLLSLIGNFFLLAVAGKAEVTDSTFYGFTVKTELTVRQNPDSLFKYLVRDVGLWWDPQHTFSGSATNLIIQPKANGCFCERLENGGSVRHMTIVFVEPGKILRMTGGMGPLQGMAVEGAMTFQFKPSGAETVLTLTYIVGGYAPGGMAKLAPMVDQVLDEQMQRLRVYAESTK
jgi:uncharacterized protein YndB with AHSA1/START domain